MELTRNPRVATVNRRAGDVAPARGRRSSMDFTNETGFPAALLRTAIDEDRLSASVLARVTYDIVGTTLRPADEHPYIVSEAPWESPNGPFECDQPFKTGGVDLLVFGKAYAPSGRETSAMKVSVVLGRFRRDVVVIGPRTWTRSGSVLVPGPPRPFRTVPLELEYAFGGKSTWDGMEVPWLDNPKGLGFYIEERQAEGQPLPMLEDPLNPIRRWNDRPPVMGFGFCPLQSGARLSAALEYDEARMELTRVKPALYNTAFPHLVAPEAPLGATVTLVGCTPGAPLAFQLPRAALCATLRLGDKRYERPLAIEQVGIDVERRKVFLTHRFPFRYRLVRKQLRSVSLTLPPEGAHA